MQELTNEQKWALEKFQETIEKSKSEGKGMSDAELCKKIGSSPQVYSPIKNGTYTGNVDKQLQKVIEYFKVKTEATIIETDTGYKETSASKVVYKAIQSAQVLGGMVLVQGDAGVGKTQACMKFKEDYRSTAIMITAKSFVKSPRAILELIGKELNVPYGPSSKMWNEIADKLSDGMVIIIDEAQHLSGATIDGIRSFSDMFENEGQTLGIALVGNDTIYSKIKKSGLNQINNRIKNIINITSSKLTYEDMQLLFPELTNEPEALEFLLLFAQSDESVRGAKNLYNNSRYQKGENALSKLKNAAKKRKGI